MNLHVVIENPPHDPHHRTTIETLAPKLVVFVEAKRPWQTLHDHHFSDLTRFGDGVCQSCGATGWSESWVAEGVFGANTHSWADARYRACMDLVDRAAEARIIDTLGGVVMDIEPLDTPVEPVKAPLVAIMAGLDPAEPARRKGIDVPQMEFMRLS